MSDSLPTAQAQHFPPPRFCSPIAWPNFRVYASMWTSRFPFILWRIDTLLSSESVTATVSGQRLGKHVPAATNMHALIELLLKTACFLRGPCRDVITRTVGAMSSIASSISQRVTA
jgi:hypothetical protein